MSINPKGHVEIKIPFYDIDPMKIVWHGNYLKYFELARCAVLDEIGYGYKDMGESGYSWPVIDIRAKYVKSATLGLDIICSGEIVEYENRLKIKYEIICKETKARLTKGYSTQVAVDLKTNEMQLASPSVLMDKMEVFYENN